MFGFQSASARAASRLAGGRLYVIAAIVSGFALFAVSVPLAVMLMGHAAEALPLLGAGAGLSYFWLRQVFKSEPRDHTAVIAEYLRMTVSCRESCDRPWSGG